MVKGLSRKIDSILVNTADPSLKKRAKRILEELELKKGDKVLEVGCGDGYYLHLISNLFDNVGLTGVDIDKEALKSAKNNLKRVKVNLIKADVMQRLPFSKNKFNKVVMSEVAEHLADDKKGLLEIYRVVKSGGIICLTVPNSYYSFLWDPINWVLEHIFSRHISSGFFAGIWNQHVRLYAPYQIKKVLEDVGFKVEKLEVNTFWSLPFSHYLINLGARILAGGANSEFLTSGARKFEISKKRGFVPGLYFAVSEAVDGLNGLWRPRNMGVSIFVKARK